MVLESNIENWTVIRQTAMLYDKLMSKNMDDGLMFHTCVNSPLEWSTARTSATLYRNIIRADVKGELNTDNFWKHCFNLTGGEKNRITGCETMEAGLRIISGSFLSAFISLMIALTGNELRQIIGWLLGSVSMRGWEYIRIFLPFFLVGTGLLLSQGKELNALAFGEERAQHLGIHVQRRKMIILLAGSMLTGAAVAVSGTIGFVGLVIPHFVRILVGPDHRHLMGISLFVGSGFMILADLLARTIITPTELPIGVITAIVGAPVFAGLLLRRRKRS